MKIFNAVTFAAALCASALTTPLQAQPASPGPATELMAFWRDAGPARWFVRNDGFDQALRERYLPLHEAAARGELDAWAGSADGAVALVLLLNQMPRHLFRGTSRMYATDAQAAAVAERAVAHGFDRAFGEDMRFFLYQPFGHSEQLQLQQRSVELSRNLGRVNHLVAKGHHDIIKQFGRFPGRNAVLGRPMLDGEQQFLDNGGFAE